MFNRLHILFPPLYLPPLIGIALAYIIGISLCWTIRFSIIPSIIVLSACCALLGLFFAALWYYSGYRKTIAVHVIFLFLGCWRSYSSYASLEHFPFGHYAQPVSITGVVTGNSYSSKGRMKHSITLFAQTAHGADHKEKTINRSVQVYLARKPALSVGDTIEIHNVLLKPSTGPFKEYLVKEDILASLFITHFSYNLVHSPHYSVHRWLWNMRERLVNNLSKKLSAPVHAFFCALFLGNRSRDKHEVETISDQFKQWGAVHYMVRAGLHLVMFVGMWYALLSFIPIPFAAKQILMLLLCLLYYVLSCSSIAFLRALLTFLFYRGAILLNLNTHSLHIISLVTLLVLLINPTQLFFLDFQLSFAVTFALAWFNHAYISPPAAPL